MPVIRKSRLVIFHLITPTALKKPFNKTQIPINKQVSMPIAMWKPGMYMSFLYFKLRVCYFMPPILRIPSLRVRCEWGYLEDSKKLEELVASMFSLRVIDCFSHRNL